MERLEAAMEKARSDREISQVVVTSEKNDALMPTPASDLWNQLREVKISPRTARKNRLTALQQGKDSGPYDLLRSRTLRQMQENDWTTLAITSPYKTCGKTTVCANLALSLSRRSDLRIVVVDLDLRRPALHKILGQRPEHSIHEVFRGKHPIETAFVRVGPNLAFGLNTGPADKPSELLQSKQTQTKLDEIKSAFSPDLILIDMPPMLVSDDNVGFLPFVDCGLLIGAAGSTTVEQLDICEKELAELTNVLGIVLNKCRYTDNKAGYDYDYY